MTALTNMADKCADTRCGKLVGTQSVVLFRHQYWHVKCAEEVYRAAMGIDRDDWLEMESETRRRILETA